MESHTYQTSIEWKKERIGVLSSPELQESFDVATPPNFKGGVPNIWSPEHLYTASVNSCYMTTFLAIAENSKLNFTSFSCDAKGILEMKDGKYLMTEVELLAHLTIEQEAEREKAEKVLQKSEKACLISNSITAKVNLITDIRVLSAVTN